MMIYTIMDFNFREWFEATTLQTNVGGVGTLPPQEDDDDGNDDDDKEWSWENVQTKYGQAIQQWVDTSPCAKKIKGAIIRRLFSQEPHMGDIDIFSEKEEDTSPQSDVEMSVEWSYPEEDIESRLFNTLRNASTCDLWKAFKIQPKDMWSLLDKGHIFNYIHYVFNLALSGLTTQIQKLPDKVMPAGQWLDKQSQWAKDKLTIGKYAIFQTKEMMEKFEKHVEEYVLDMYNFHARERKRPEAKGVNLSLSRPPQSNGQTYNHHYWARVRLQWDYSVIF